MIDFRIELLIFGDHFCDAILFYVRHPSKVHMNIYYNNHTLIVNYLKAEQLIFGDYFLT